MMNFSSLVLMEKDKESNFFVKEIGSYEVGDGAEKITKFFYDGEMVNAYFDTGRDVEEWEYSAIFDLFNIENFVNNGYEIQDNDDEYNPTWLVKFKYIEDHIDMQKKLNELCEIIEVSMDKVFNDIKDKQEEYSDL